MDLDAIRSTQAGKRLSERQPLVDDVHDVLADMLLNHNVGPGERLNIDALSRSLGVSPTPIREALARMEAEGLVVKEPHRGYAVAPLISFNDLRDLMNFRLLIEPEAARQAARLANSTQASNLVAFARSGGSGGADAATNRLDMAYDAAFHRSVAELGANAWLRDSLVRLRSHQHMYRLYHHAKHAAATKPEHVAIAKAIASGDPDASSEAMRTHLQTALDRLEVVFASGDLPFAPDGTPR